MKKIYAEHIGSSSNINELSGIYITSPLTSQFGTSSRKILVNDVGPVVVYRITDPKSFLLCALDGKFLVGLLNMRD